MRCDARSRFDARARSRVESRESRDTRTHTHTRAGATARGNHRRALRSMDSVSRRSISRRARR
jgi:hypothetical protein